MTQLVDNLPDKLLQRAFDPVVRAFLVARQDDPALTVEAFFGPFENLGEVLARRWSIDLDDIVEDDILRGDELPRIAEQFRKAAEKTRPYPKREVPLRHDVAHYALITQQRATNPKTWFLTLDRSLVAAAADLSKEGSPFCFSLAGFLQSISPFVQTTEEAHSLADLFSAVITDQVFTREALFETRELLVLAEMHDDVLGSTPEQLVKAFDTVRSTATRGREYTPSEKAAIALDLRKQLAATASSRHQALNESIERLEREKAREQSERQKAESQRDALTSQISEVTRQLNDTRATQERAQQESASLRAEVERVRSQKRIAKRLAVTLVGLLLSAAMWTWDEAAIRWLGSRWPQLGDRIGGVGMVLNRPRFRGQPEDSIHAATELASRSRRA